MDTNFANTATEKVYNILMVEDTLNDFKAKIESGELNTLPKLTEAIKEDFYDYIDANTLDGNMLVGDLATALLDMADFEAMASHILNLK